MSQSNLPESSELPESAENKMQWARPTCTDLEEVKIEGGGGFATETFTGLTS